jgi:predicted metal-dependent hydrolase
MTDAAQHSIVFGGETLAFLIERTARRKTVAISVGFDGVRVLAPSDLDDDRVLGIVRKKGAWLLRKQAAYRELGGQPVAKEFVSGETFHYLGRQYRLKLVPDETAIVTRIAARGSTLVAPVLPSGHASVQRAAVRSGLRHWYRAHAIHHFTIRSRMFAEKLGIRTPTVKVFDQS